MAYLIDGNNLIGHTPTYKLKSIKSKLRLIFKLKKFQRIEKSKIILIFDGPPDISVPELDLDSKKFTIIFSDLYSADSKIKDFLSTKKNLRNYYLISSDGELLNYARRKGVKTMKCPDFNKKIKKIFREHKREDNKKEHYPSPLEVKHWSEIFKRKNE